MKALKVIVSATMTSLLSAALLGQATDPADVTAWHGKTVMVFCPHPDDDLASAGTMAKLVKNGNKVYVVLYTTGNKGSRDLDMTSERLAQIRRQEDLAANKIIGIPAENIIWLGYDDGMLEYVPQKELVEKVCWLVRKYRPDAVFSLDPGSPSMKWHKTDHRMSAFITVDGARAAAYHLYFPSQRINEGLQPFTITDFFFWSSDQPNYKVDITDVAELKAQAASQHTSQFGKGNVKYTGPEMDAADRERIRARYTRKDAEGKVYERFRRLQESLSF
jgi:LmbE family N-acetylglucosaminyl deacetylase